MQCQYRQYPILLKISRFFPDFFTTFPDFVVNWTIFDVVKSQLSHGLYPPLYVAS